MLSFLSTFLSMGIPTIDKSLDELLHVLLNVAQPLPPLHALAKSLGLILALCAVAYECWMMMLGRRVIDVLKLLRIIGLSLVISNIYNITIPINVAIASIFTTPAKHAAQSMTKRVAAKELQVAQLQDKYYERVRALQDSIESAQKIETIGKDANVMTEILYSVTNLGTTIENMTKRAAIVTETKITEWVNLIIRFIGEVIFQVSYYGLLVMQLVFLKLLQMVAPIMFALSITPVFSNAWSQWLSKYISISLWGFVAYVCVYYASGVMLYTIEKDIHAYTVLIGKSNIGSWESIGTLGMQGIGSTCMYFVGLCVGAVLLKSVPEVCSWLFPGGVSSSTASSAGSTMIGAAGATAGYAAASVPVVGSVMQSGGQATGSATIVTAGVAARTTGAAASSAKEAYNKTSESPSGGTASAIVAGTLGAVKGGVAGGLSTLDGGIRSGTFNKTISDNFNKGKSMFGSDSKKDS